jgi:betaine reductase
VKAALLSASYALFHVPDLVRFGSKPARQLASDPGVAESLRLHLRSFDAAVAYPPNQVFIGNLAPEALEQIERPWHRQPLEGATPSGGLGRIFDQRTFYARLAESDSFKLVHFNPEGDVRDIPPGGLGLCDGERGVGWIEAGHPHDESQTANVMLENLACKTTAVEAARLCLDGFDASTIDYVLNTGEEAIGDRYQRGGGNLAKAVAEAVGCTNATGADVKAFCCAPAHAVVMAAAFVEAGLYQHVLVVGGGSLAKLGMKFEGHLRKGMPVLEDTLASMAFLIGPADGLSPTIDLRSVGRHPVAAGASPQAIYTALVAEPLRLRGLRFADVDKYAVELHDPDVTEPAGSGNVPLLNYRAIAALAVMGGQIKPRDIPDFVQRHGMPGFSPTQGHIASGMPYLGHARREMLEGRIKRVMVVAKGSLFLGKMTQLSDGMSFMLESA